METPERSPSETLDYLMAITQSSPDAHVQGLRAELMSMCNERDLNQHRVAKLCAAMEKERRALHNVLPSARKTIDAMEAKKAEAETRLAAVEEELRRERAARTHRRGLGQSAHEVLELVGQEHQKLLGDIQETIARLSQVEPSVVSKAASAKFQAIHQAITWLHAQSCGLTAAPPAAASEAPCPAETPPLPEFVEELQAQAKQADRRAHSYQEQLQEAKAEILRLELQAQQQWLLLRHQDTDRWSPEERPNPSTPPALSQQQQKAQMSREQDLRSVPRLHLRPPSIPQTPPQTPPHSPPYGMEDFDLDARVKELLDGDPPSRSVSVTSESSLLNDAGMFTAQMEADTSGTAGHAQSQDSELV